MKSGQVYKGLISGVEEQYESPDILLILPLAKLSPLIDRDIIGTYRQAFVREL